MLQAFLKLPLSLSLIIHKHEQLDPQFLYFASSTMFRKILDPYNSAIYTTTKGYEALYKVS
jgi:hypothetical protein